MSSAQSTLCDLLWLSGMKAGGEGKDDSGVKRLIRICSHLSLSAQLFAQLVAHKLQHRPQLGRAREQSLPAAHKMFADLAASTAKRLPDSRLHRLNHEVPKALAFHASLRYRVYTIYVLQAIACAMILVLFHGHSVQVVGSESFQLLIAKSRILGSAHSVLRLWDVSACQQSLFCKQT